MMSTNGIITRDSDSPVRDTMDRLAKTVTERGATIYVRIDQQAEALKSGIKIAPLEFLLFGNPERGARLMAKDPLFALDLPLKIICWQDGHGKTRVAFNDFEFIGTRYGHTLTPGSPLDLAPLVEAVLTDQLT